MYFFIWLLNIIVFLFLLSFAAKNTEIITIHYYSGFEWQAPLIVVLLAFFASGIILGYFFCLIKRLSKKL
ncbi:lipopolysaccharide assembly protein LapA domain-containing protein [Nitrosomonas communis]|uniref:lipopolysaccharide assembly protein LapA domain-containing protein n=1 Tax=Nitrosomonas communis TaxID=44574 RepID=UPI000945AE07